MKDRNVGMALMGVTVLLWSTIEVVSKVIQEDIPPLCIAFLRFFIGGFFLLPLVFVYGRRIDRNKIGWKDTVQFLLLSFLGISAAFILYHKALIWIDASSVATLVSMVPLLVAPISIYYLKEKVGIVSLVGLSLGAVGIFILYQSEESGYNSLIGSMIMILAVFCFSIYTVFMKPINDRTDPKVTTSLSLLLGSLMMIPFLIFEGEPLVVAGLSWQSAAGILYLSIFSVGLAYLFYFMSLNKLIISKGSSLLYLKPATASLIAWIFIDEYISPIRIASIVVVSLSVYFIVRDEQIRGFLRKLRVKDIDEQGDD
ncbi:MAG: DMT family transporter [Thermoplasmatota archaeon]